jgi:dTDP-4-dehydrorhamnose 3,5-epimerase
MNISPTKINGIFVIETASTSDARGKFTRLFCELELGPVLDGRHIVQINHSCNNKKGSLRGLHYQNPPHAEMKMVRCLKGRVWDVAVDLRAGSPTFLNWHAEILSARDQHMLVIPEGCAHGFQVLDEESELLYLHTAAYHPDSEAGVAWDDPRLGITWPLSVSDISDRDRSHARLPVEFPGIIL